MLKRKIVLYSLLVCGVLIIQSADALEDWQQGAVHAGQSSRQIDADGGPLAVRVDFAVFDTVANPDAWGGENGFDIPGDGQYVYAYQIFNDENLGTETLTAFSLLKENGENISDAAIMGTGWENDMTGEDISPEDMPTASSWDFNGFFIPGEHSSFLVISSDNTWVKGDYELGTYEDILVPEDAADEPVLVPEPTSIILLISGSCMLFRNRKKQSV